MSVLDLQGLTTEAEGKRDGGGGGGGGSTLTVALCQSVTPSNLSVAACHF
ncbi:MAG TPA: SapB/AmfS family lanthipeptide [Solirubrobacteraceae bacterium]